jgi:hypothetical protein
VKNGLFGAWVAILFVKLTCSEIVRMERQQSHEGVSKPRKPVRAISKMGHVQFDKYRARMVCKNLPLGAAHISLIRALTPSVPMPACEAAYITAACASRTSPLVIS